MSNSNALSTLDKVRFDRGNSNLSNYFRKILVKNPPKAMELLNEDNLSFPSLFILFPQINKPHITRHLNLRNKAAMTVTKAILSKDFSNFNRHTRDIDVPEILRWILQTGKDDNLARSEYIDIVDSCAILLVREYKDDSILPVLRDIIFNRYRQGLFIHDLVWAFFECRNPNCILILAEGFNSNDIKDVELTKELLKFIPVVNCNNLPKELLYKNVRYWLRDNLPFIYYTGESFQQMPNPSPFDVSLGAKYLFRKVSSDGNIEGTLSEDEKQLLNTFDSLDVNSRILLSSYSFVLHNQNIYWWNNWLHSPVEEQIRIFSAKLGGAPC